MLVMADVALLRALAGYWATPCSATRPFHRCGTGWGVRPSVRRILVTGVGVLLAVAACANTPQPGSGESTSTGVPASHAVTTPAATPTAAGRLPSFDHIVVVVFENKDVD